jgi:hypothetical protein
MIEFQCALCGEQVVDEPKTCASCEQQDICPKCIDRYNDDELICVDCELGLTEFDEEDSDVEN